MFDNKFIITLITLIIGIIAICNFNKKDGQITEDFGLLNLTVKSDRGMMDPHTNSFVSTPNFQSMTSPRFSNVDYGANIRYNMPSYQHQASPHNPLGDNNNACGISQNRDVIENFPTSCNKSQSIPANFSSENELHNIGGDTDVTSMFPVESMNTVGIDGTSQQTVMYDRLMVSTRNSRNRSQGDKIRGDIVPCCATGKDVAWLPTAALNPELSLEQGAMNVMGGMDNVSAKNMAVLMNDATGATTFAGANLSGQELMSLGANQTDLTVSGFV